MHLLLQSSLESFHLQLMLYHLLLTSKDDHRLVSDQFVDNFRRVNERDLHRNNMNLWYQEWRVYCFSRIFITCSSSCRWISSYFVCSHSWCWSWNIIKRKVRIKSHFSQNILVVTVVVVVNVGKVIVKVIAKRKLLFLKRYLLSLGSVYVCGLLLLSRRCY